MCTPKAAVIVLGILAAGVAAQDVDAFQEMVKQNLLKSPKLQQMLDDPDRMRETLQKISEQNGMPGFKDVDKLINDLRDESSSSSPGKKSDEKAEKAKKNEKSGAAATKTKKNESTKKNETNKKSEAKKSEAKKKKGKKAGGLSGIPGMENLQELMSNPEKMKEAMDQLGAMPGMENLRDVMSNPEKMKEAMNKFEDAGGMGGAMKKMKEEGHLDKLKEQLGSNGAGLDMDSMMDKLKDVDMESVMSKLSSADGMAEMMKTMQNMGLGKGDEEL